MFYELEREYKMLKREEMELAILNKIEELKKAFPNIMQLSAIQEIVQKGHEELSKSVKYRRDYVLERKNFFEVNYYDLINRVKDEITQIGIPPVELCVEENNEVKNVIKRKTLESDVAVTYYNVYLKNGDEKILFFKCTTMNDDVYLDSIKEKSKYPVYESSKATKSTLCGATNDRLIVNLLTDFDNFDINLNTPKSTKDNWNKRVTYNISNYVMWKLVYENCVNLLKNENEKLEAEYNDLENKLLNLSDKIKLNKSYIARHTEAGFKTREY